MQKVIIISPFLYVLCITNYAYIQPYESYTHTYWLALLYNFLICTYLCKYVCLSILPFATSVNLDEEDLFMVCDLLTGGDLRYHLQNRVSAIIYKTHTHLYSHKPLRDIFILK